MRPRSNRIFIMIIACIFGFATPNLHAFLASAKAAGMALTGAAYPQDALAGAFNPAGIVEICDRADLGFAWDHFEAGYCIEGNAFPIPGTNGCGSGTRFKDFFTPDFGVNFNYCFCGIEMAAGFVAYNRDVLKTTFRDRVPNLGTTPPGLELIREEASLVWAIRLFDCHSFGISLNGIGQRFKANGLQNFLSPLFPFTADPSSVTNRGYSYSVGFGATFGWRSQLTDWLAFGIAYAPKVKMPRFNKYHGLLAQGGRLDVPENLLAGIAITYLPCTTITFDFNWINWDRVRALHNPIIPNVFTPFGLGSNNGAGFGWRSQYIYRVGIDYQLDPCWTIRAGYRYGNSPIRSSLVAANILTLETVEQYVTVGLSYALMDCVEATVFYAHGFDHRIRGPIPLLPFGGGTLKIHEFRDVAGLSFGVCF